MISAHPKLREWAFLVTKEPRCSTIFLSLYESPPPHAGAGARHEAIEDALKKVARVKGATFAPLHQSVRRAMQHQAFCDWRDYGKQSAG